MRLACAAAVAVAAVAWWIHGDTVGTPAVPPSAAPAVTTHSSAPPRSGTPGAAATRAAARPAPLFGDAVAQAREHDVRVGIAVADLDNRRIWSAGVTGELPTGSVVKALIATRMLLAGRMTGPDARTAWEMIVGSNDEDGTILFNEFGGTDIVPWLNAHYGFRIGRPNVRPGYWGNTQVTARSLAQFYLTVAHDPSVWPWLSHAMANTRRIAADGTDQYFGIPDAGGGHTVKQSWGTHSVDDGYGVDATVNSTGIVTVGTHRYAVVLLSRGDRNAGQADSRGLVRAQADVLTAVARRVLAELPQLADLP